MAAALRWACDKGYGGTRNEIGTRRQSGASSSSYKFAPQPCGIRTSVSVHASSSFQASWGIGGNIVSAACAHRSACYSGTPPLNYAVRRIAQRSQQAIHARHTTSVYATTRKSALPPHHERDKNRCVTFHTPMREGSPAASRLFANAHALHIK